MALLHPDLAPLAPIVGSWRSSGTIYEDAVAVGEIAGTDVYRPAPAGPWIVHEVDVLMGQDRVQALELIGGQDDDAGWQMHAFDDTGVPGTMRLTSQEPGLLLLQGDGVRSWLRPEAGPDHMTTRWEREADGVWSLWMDMSFERIPDDAG